MRSRIVSRKLHKWLGALLGVQLVIWTLSGLYMTAISIDIIHGDHFIDQQAGPSVPASELADPIALMEEHEASDFRLARVMGRDAYVLDDTLAVDARTREPIARPDEADIRAAATRTYTGSGDIASIALIDDMPGEIRGRTPPIWRVEFDHWNKPTLYFSPATGELVTRRHELWRIFDFLWMLHIMDYDEREDVNNWLLRPITWLAFLFVLTGGWMLVHNFPRRKKKVRP